jgi:Uma2 family endonuclease
MVKLMTFTTARFTSFDAYLTAETSELPEGRYEYWDGELVPVMAESLANDTIATYLFVLFLTAGISFDLLRPHNCEIEVLGRPRTRFPDFTVLDEIHLTLMDRRLMITREMPPPPLVVEVVSPGDENSENYKRDYQDKRDQYAAIGIPEYWLIDPERSWVMVGTLMGDRYKFKPFRGAETIVSPGFPMLQFTALQVLAAGRSEAA